MFIENFLFVSSCVLLSSGFVFWSTNDFVEGKVLGSKYSKKNNGCRYFKSYCIFNNTL